MIIRSAVLAAALIAAACSSAPRQTETRRCAFDEDHPALQKATQPLFRDCDVDIVAQPRETPLSYRPHVIPRGGGCLFAEVLFIVDPSGRPEPASIELARSNDHNLAAELTAAVRGWRYAPAQKDGQPVRQLVRTSRSIAVAVTTVRAGEVPSTSRTASRAAARAACPAP